MMVKFRKLLYVTNSCTDKPMGGRAMLSVINYKILKIIKSNDLLVYRLNDNKISTLKSTLAAFQGHIDGLNSRTINSITSLSRIEGIKQVFVDGSNLGALIAIIKKSGLELEVITFFHNVESRFFWGLFMQKKTFHSLGVLFANYLAERKAVKYSDKIICLNKRDSQLLKRIYGKSATHITPMVLEDLTSESYLNDGRIPPQHFAVFVGGNFYANRLGIEWFIREVSPRIDIPIYIIGRGFEQLRDEYESSGKVVVVGTVDSLEDWYRMAQFVVAPIFDGSGMKTKVAEAMMYGKKVIGTKEAFTGYEDIAHQIGWICNTSNEFVDAIKIAAEQITESIDLNLRNIYLDRYSMESGLNRMVKIL